MRRKTFIVTGWFAALNALWLHAVMAPCWTVAGLVDESPDVTVG